MTGLIHQNDNQAGVRSRLTIVAGALCLVVLLTLACSPARAAFGVTDGSFVANSFDASSRPDTRAGAHPFEAATAFDFNTVTRPSLFGGTLQFPDERLKNAIVDLPPGFVGDPRATDQCSLVVFYATTNNAACPATAQVGVAALHYSLSDRFPPSVEQFPVFSLPPVRGEVAAFGIYVLTVPVVLSAKINPIDNTVRVTVKNTNEGAALSGQRIALWGAPADPIHDSQRACGPNAPNPEELQPNTAGCHYSLEGTPKAFIANPTSCTGPVTTKLAINSWQHPDDVKRYAYTTPEGGSDCARVPFAPEVAFNPSSTRADGPAGADISITLPYSDDPGSLSTGHLKDVTVALPDGLTVNPGGANGLAACTDEQVGIATDRAFDCPDASKIGTATATTPVLDETLTGGVYVGTQQSGDPASGDMFRLFLRLTNAERGIDVRLAGKIHVDPQTGKITTVFANNPQLPVGTISLKLKSGATAPLATPSTCGAKSVASTLSSWSGKTVTRDTTFNVDCRAGLGAFAPRLDAGTTNSTAGASTAFALSLDKPDGDAAVDGLSLTMPTGLLARLKGNLGTQVGTVKAFAGPGSSPFMLPGKVFLEGRYDDAPFSLRAVVPAKAGPFDLGEVVVRQKIYVDPIDAHVTVVSDPLPTIVKGVPVRLQRLDVDVDKADFMINPTSCAPKAIGGTLHAADGQTAPIDVRFQVSDCSSLDLKPTLGLTLSGKGQTTDGKHPAVTAVVSQPAGQANLKKVRVALPLSLALDPDNAASDDLCSFVEGSKVDPKCPASSVVGKATAVSPILNEPLSGPVFFVKNERKDPKSGRSIKTTPKLVIPLVGENGVKLTLTGTSTVADDQLVTTFDNIPDAPVSSFKMDINGGKKGILVVSGADICKSTQVADQQVDGQNNKQADADVFIQTPSCPLKVLSKKVAKSSVAIKVGGLGAGKVTITGKGIKKTTKAISKSTVATITAKRTKGKPGKVTVSFDPAGPVKARKTSR